MIIIRENSLKRFQKSRWLFVIIKMHMVSWARSFRFLHWEWVSHLHKQGSVFYNIHGRKGRCSTSLVYLIVLRNDLLECAQLHMPFSCPLLFVFLLSPGMMRCRFSRQRFDVWTHVKKFPPHLWPSFFSKKNFH